MSGLAAALAGLLAAGQPVVLVTVVATRGSTPRETGARMLVHARGVAGTIGGGTLEWRAIARARAMVAAGEVEAELDLPLGPELGQCCGGWVRLALVHADRAHLVAIRADEEAEHRRQPQVVLFGAGHVGRALARALAPLPLRLLWIDPRPGAFPNEPPAEIELGLAPVEAVAAAPAETGFLIATHSHALDFELVAAVLRRGDFAHLGLIGSASKRARFARGLRALGLPAEHIARLVCPIGFAHKGDKRPEVIAALATAELWLALARVAARNTGGCRAAE